MAALDFQLHLDVSFAWVSHEEITSVGRNAHIQNICESLWRKTLVPNTENSVDLIRSYLPV